MNLVIVDKNGVVHEVVEDIEKFNLNKPLARSDVVNKIIGTIERIKRKDRNG